MNWYDVFSNKTADEKTKSLNNILLNIFRNFIPNNVIKFDYQYPKWMNPKIISSLRNRSKLTKRYYFDPTEENINLLSAKSNKCSNMIVETKERYTNKLSKKLDDPSTVPKEFSPILNIFFYNENIPNITPLNINGKLFLISRKERNSSIHFLPLNVLQLSTQMYFHH